MFTQREIIDAIRKSYERWKFTQEKPTKRCTSLTEKWKTTRRKQTQVDTFLQTVTDTVGTQVHGMNSTIAKMKEEDARYKQISEKIMNMEKKTEETNPVEHMESSIRVRL